MTEHTRLERWDQRTDRPLAGVALVFLALYSVKVLVRPHGGVDKAVDIGLLIVYCLFVVDYLARFYLAEPRGKWFIRHLWELPVIVLPFLRPLRLLSLAVVVNALQRAVGHTIRGKVIVYTAVGAVVIVYAASLAVLDVEGTLPESDIRNLGDAMWWAVTTVTTVGYGDKSPVTPMGKLVAVALMIGGIALVGSVTATLASWIVQRVAEEDTADEVATRAQIEELRDEIRRLSNLLTDEDKPAYGEGREAI
ncbi:potassium channel family protein [Mycobacterium sp. NPDC048908]|uniref:potassium channel family protein n=1 Tax=Mycobacterium sp. NPDC048908 TaxID=3364292 RepID=UPI0037181918